MKRFLPFFALAAAALIATPAFAGPDASGPLPADATSTVDAGSSPVDAGASDAGVSDAVAPPNDATGTTGGFNINPCWDEKCPTETKACQTDKICAAFITCTKGGKSQTDCGKELKLDQAGSDALSAILDPMQACGWKTCADPTKGTCQDKCGNYLGRNSPCNCDDQCAKYNDCCPDYATVCPKP